MLMATTAFFEDRQFPDKAIDLIDEACATRRMKTDNILKSNSIQNSTEAFMEEAIVCPAQVAEVCP